MPSKAFPLAHSLVLQFLELNKYHKTLNAFREEASEVIIENSEVFRQSPEKNLIDLVDEHLISRMTDRLGKLSLQRQIEEELNQSGNENIPRFLYDTFNQIHDANILSVRTQNLPITNFLEGENEYAYSHVTAIVTGSADKSIKFTSLLTRDTFNTLQVHKSPVLCVDFHPDYPTLMLSGSMDSTVVLVNVNTNETLQTFKDHSKYVIHARFSPDGSMFATASHDHTVNFYKMLPPSTVPNTPRSPASPRSPTFNNQIDIKYAKVHSMIFTGNVEAFCFLPNNESLVIGVREDNYLHYVDLVNFQDTKYNMNENGDEWVSFTPMDISPSPHNNGKYLLVSTDDETGRQILFLVNSDVQVRNFYGARVNKFSTPRHCWHPSGKYFYVTDDTKGDICIFDVATAKIIGRLEGHTSIVKSLWFDIERDLLISCGFDKTIRVWGVTDVTPEGSIASSENVSDTEK
ncbi:7756_t:CDS:2 [Ambispora gerdemannii]|uniref:7756_t:CDS:1 n=1 Tax=Ambispora gerdemannii TaxID=144530 RepID=A0A9N8WHS5_9GLOM|nr:7756_t:CDS:2 [Ambispora gerdemannii]